MRATLESSDRQFLERLHRLGSATVQEICGELGVTATAVRQRLNRLQGAGLVSRITVRAGRGRPHHAYRVTEAGQRDLGDNYADLAMILWRELHAIEEPEVRERIIHRIEDALVQQLGNGVGGATVAERLGRLGAAMAGRGYDVETDFTGTLPVLRENNCPYLELASSDPGICELEQNVFRRVLGTDVTLTHCCLEGHTCCEFQAVEK